MCVRVAFKDNRCAAVPFELFCCRQSDDKNNAAINLQYLLMSFTSGCRNCDIYDHISRITGNFAGNKLQDEFVVQIKHYQKCLHFNDDCVLAVFEYLFCILRSEIDLAF